MTRQEVLLVTFLMVGVWGFKKNGRKDLIPRAKPHRLVLNHQFQGTNHAFLQALAAQTPG